MVELVKYEDVRSSLLRDPEVKAEYDALEDEFRILRLLLDMRRATGATQEEIAAKMGTQKSNVSRLENGKTDPRLSTLFSYARALGVEIEMSVKQS